MFPPALAQGLQAATPNQLANIEFTQAADALLD
jgi:hypothetical protein